MRYAQVLGRLMVIAIAFLPHHGFHAEEMAVQLFLLGHNLKPIIRSMQLFQCMKSTGCAEECELQLEELEYAFEQQ